MKFGKYSALVVGLAIPMISVCSQESASTASNTAEKPASLVNTVVVYGKNVVVDTKNGVLAYSSRVAARPGSFLRAAFSAKTARDTINRTLDSNLSFGWLTGAGAILVNPSSEPLFRKIKARYYTLGALTILYHYLNAIDENVQADQVVVVTTDAAAQEEAQPTNKKCTKCTHSGCTGGRCGR